MKTLILAFWVSSGALPHSPIISGSLLVALILSVVATSREARELRRMNDHTRADIGLSPYGLKWIE